MSTDNKTPSTDAVLIAHDVAISGIISTLPVEQAASIKNFAMSRLNNRLDLEKAKPEPSSFVLEMLNDAIICLERLG